MHVYVYVCMCEWVTLCVHACVRVCVCVLSWVCGASCACLVGVVRCRQIAKNTFNSSDSHKHTHTDTPTQTALTQAQPCVVSKKTCLHVIQQQQQQREQAAKFMRRHTNPLNERPTMQSTALPAALPQLASHCHSLSLALSCSLA